jgi:methylglyoxal synthase
MSKIAIIAHTPLKQTALNWVKHNLASLRNFRLIATEGTALMIRKQCSLSVEAVFHGPDGGDIQLAAQILNGDITAVLFFQDVNSVQAHQSDIDVLIRTAVRCNIPLALNEQTASLILQQLRTNNRSKASNLELESRQYF